MKNAEQLSFIGQNLSNSPQKKKKSLIDSQVNKSSQNSLIKTSQISKQKSKGLVLEPKITQSKTSKNNFQLNQSKNTRQTSVKASKKSSSQKQREFIISPDEDLSFIENNWVMGVDEVGRGCLAGPVCAAVALLDLTKNVDHFVDSKALRFESRQQLAKEIQQFHFTALGWASVEEIDQINIREATFLAMKRALDQFFIKYPELAQMKEQNKKTFYLLVDGKDLIPDSGFKHQWAVIKGDSRVRAISAASIVAKVARDELMMKLANTNSEYGFEIHKGYGTEKHREAIRKAGVTEHHRKTFSGVKEYL